MAGLERKVKAIPPPFDDEFPFNSEWLKYTEVTADDKSLVLSKVIFHRYRGFLLYIPLFVSLVFAVVISWLPVKIGFFLVFAYILYRCFYGIKVKEIRKVEFSREEGTVTYPVYTDGKIIENTIPFDKAPFTIVKKKNMPSTLYLEEYPLITNNTDSAWSFLVWYMDTTRPLPPGKVFDLYREKDDK